MRWQLELSNHHWDRFTQESGQVGPEGQVGQMHLQWGRTLEPVPKGTPFPLKLVTMVFCLCGISLLPNYLSCNGFTTH